MDNYPNEVDAVEKVMNALQALMQRQGYADADTKRRDVRAYLSGWPNDYSTSENIEGAVLELAKRAERRLKKQGVKARPSVPAPPEISSQTALAYVTVDAKERPKLAEAVKALRLHFWRATEPPFPFATLGTAQALDAARDWLREKRVADQVKFNGI